MHSIPPLSRGEGRPVRQRTRTFRPNYLSFAGTFQCNLSCPHCCVPIEWTDRLDIATALRFLEQSHAAGIDTLGFTGGEPLLYPEFLVALTRRAVELGFRFDKTMTNGVWFRDREHLRGILQQLREVGFSGKIGLSVDKFHGMDIAKLAEFCRVTREVFERDTILSLSYASRAPDRGLEPIRRLAAALNGVVDWSEMLGRYLLVSDDLTMTLNWNHLATVERAESLPGNPWDGQWFEEDYCEGPGQALIVNPKGEVKPCCGFASDLDELTIGNIYTDSVEQIIAFARSHPVVGTIFSRGLSALRDEILEREPDGLPGATSNHCYFCWYVLTRNLLGKAPAGLTDGKRLSLPLAGETALAGNSNIPMRFDGKTVFLGSEALARGSGRNYWIEISGPATPVFPIERMGWNDYQAWIDRLRDEGFALRTHEFEGCNKRKNVD